MKINKENYEVFLIDYLDGNLQGSEKSDVENFLLMNPEIKKEFESIENMQLSDEPVMFPLKEKLKFRKDGISEADYLCIGDMEGDLSEEEKALFEQIKKNEPEIEHDIKLFALTKQKPAMQVTFPDKAKLKQKLIRPVFWGYSAAASIVAAIIVFAMVTNDGNEQLADNSVKRKKVARKVEKTEQVKTDKNTATTKTTTESKQVAANNPIQPKSDDSFLEEFEVMEPQMEENVDYASIAMMQPETLVKIETAKFSVSNKVSTEKHELSQQLIDENKAYIEYWKKVFIENHNRK